MAVFVFYRIPLDFLQKEWMQRLFTSGSDRKKNCRFCVAWNACVRNGMMCWMVLKSGCIREVRKPIIKFAKNFIRHMEA